MTIGEKIEEEVEAILQKWGFQNKQMDGLLRINAKQAVIDAYTKGINEGIEIFNEGIEIIKNELLQK